MSTRYPNRKPVKLQELAEEMLCVPDGAVLFLHLPTGEMVFQATESGMLNPFEDAPSIEEMDASPEYLPLPNKRAIHEWDIMRRFAMSLDGNVSDELNDAVHGNGAFRMFKTVIHSRGIENDWYTFRDNAVVDIAREWCEVNSVPYLSG